MAKRILPLLIVVLLVAVLLLASKWRHEAPKISGFIEANEIRLGSRVRSLGSACTCSQPPAPRRKSIHRQLFSGLKSFSVSMPLAKTVSPIRTKHVEPRHHIGPDPLLAGSYW